MSREQGSPSIDDLWKVVQEQRSRIEELQTEGQRRGRVGRPWRALSLLAGVVIAVGALATGALASRSAKIPDANGLIHGCYSTATGNLRVTSGSCHPGERPLSWNQSAPRKFCPRCSMEFADLHGQDLTGAYFPLTSLSSVNLSNAELTSAYLVNAGLEPGPNRTVNGTPQPAPPSNLDHANFAMAEMRGIDLAAAKAPSSQYVGADMHYAYMDDANFSQANFLATDLSFGFARGTSFKGAFLEYANIQDMSLSRADFSDADLRSAHGTPIDVSNAVFSNTACPDGTISNNNAGNTCAGHWLP